MRIDKYLWAIRFYKSRNEASIACKKGHVRIDETIV
ncbi:MAG: S4 domain-containing protein, partial [Flavobacteriaceae bacterium]